MRVIGRRPKIVMELEKKGYEFYKLCSSYDEAKKVAAELRKKYGYKARALELSTNVIGLHDYVVYVKRKR